VARKESQKIHRHTKFWKRSIWKTVKKDGFEVDMKGMNCDGRWVEPTVLAD
jgi:hypothetical protein